MALISKRLRTTALKIPQGFVYNFKEENSYKRIYSKKFSNTLILKIFFYEKLKAFLIEKKNEHKHYIHRIA